MKPASPSSHRRLKVAALVVALVVVAAACEATPGDFTRDGKADEVYWAGGTGNWFTSGNATPIFTGQNTDIPVAGDYNGDLKWEPAVVRGTSWISSALTDPIDYDPAGMPAGPAATLVGRSTPPTLLPVPGHYDDTGKTQPAYYDQVDATWWIMGRTGDTQFGIPPAASGNYAYDLPAPADYDGDGKTDIAIFRPSDGTFHYLSSKTGQEVDLPAVVAPSAGGLLPVPGDYDNVGHDQAAVTDLSGSKWWVAGDANPVATFATIPSNDNWLPAPAPYDGNGKVEAAVMDLQTGALWRTGSPMPTTGPQTRGPNMAAVTPWYVLVNLVRLTLYDQCRFDPPTSPDALCASVT